MTVLDASFWRSLVAGVAVLAAAGFLVTGCGQESGTGNDGSSGPAAADSAASDSSEGVDRYEVRGRIEGIQNEAGDAPRLRIWHERIESFRTYSGRVEPMDAMVMEFPVAEGVAIDDLAEGDGVRFTFEMRWQGPQRGYKVTSIDPLPAGTELDLEPQDMADSPPADDASSRQTQDHDHQHAPAATGEVPANQHEHADDHSHGHNHSHGDDHSHGHDHGHGGDHEMNDASDASDR